MICLNFGEPLSLLHRHLRKHGTTPVIILFNLRLGRFDILAEQWTAKVPFKVTREAPGEVIVDVARLRVIFTNFRRTAQGCS